METSQIIPHLFRTEYSKMVSVLTCTYGLQFIETAEDVVSDTFLIALDNWPYKGIPQNPTAWLYTVAKNQLKNKLARDQKFFKITSEPLLTAKQYDEADINFSDKNIADSQLQMLFAICHPSISDESQICLALRILCGLGLNEIADAFLSNKETIHKRLQRAKEKLLAEKINVDLPGDAAIAERLDTVTRTIYLLFSEGYYSESNRSIIRKELCIEALNLAYLLLNNSKTNNHETNALVSLMCFQASRLEARQSETGDIILYQDQNRSRWDNGFIEKGFYYLQQASKWKITSAYYIEASIAYWFTVGDEHAEKWPSILKLYNALLVVNKSPVVALNRIWAFSKVYGNAMAIEEALPLKMETNHFYFVLLAELYKHIDYKETKTYLNKAFDLCRNEKEKELIRSRIENI